MYIEARDPCDMIPSKGLNTICNFSVNKEKKVRQHEYDKIRPLVKHSTTWENSKGYAKLQTHAVLTWKYQALDAWLKMLIFYSLFSDIATFLFSTQTIFCPFSYHKVAQNSIRISICNTDYQLFLIKTPLTDLSTKIYIRGRQVYW